MNRPRVILIIAASLDGRIALPHGGNSQIGSIEDKNLLNESLSKVDATLFGSGTLKAHKSTFLTKKYCVKDKIYKINNQPISIIAGKSNKFSSEWLYFQQPIRRWLISKKDNNNKSNHLNFEKEFFFEGSWLQTLKLFNNDGIRRIGLLGGSKLISSFAKENLIDEIKITIVPKIIGGKFSWIQNNEKNILLNSKENWQIKSIKTLPTEEIWIHYTKKN